MNWCPALGTVLANEEVIDGNSERGSHPVVRLPLRQWMLRITAYADRLENDLDSLDWPESIKELQRNWIGRSTGAEVDFFVGSKTADNGMPSQEEFEYWVVDRIENGFAKNDPATAVLRIYTTRPDTLFGATYMVIAPEHPFVERLTTPEQAAAVEAYCQQGRLARAISTAPIWPRRRPASSPAPTPSIRSTARQFPSGSPTTCSSATAPVRSWPSPPTMSAISSSPSKFDLPIIPVVDPGEAAGELARASCSPASWPSSPTASRSTPAASTA